MDSYLLPTVSAVSVMQGAVQKLPTPKELFQALYCHFLRLADVGLRSAESHSPHSSPEPSSGLAAFVGDDVEGDRQLCVRAMAAVCHEHAAAVGEPFPFCIACSIHIRTAVASIPQAMETGYCRATRSNRLAWVRTVARPLHCGPDAAVYHSKQQRVLYVACRIRQFASQTCRELGNRVDFL